MSTRVVLCTSACDWPLNARWGGARGASRLGPLVGLMAARADEAERSDEERTNPADDDDGRAIHLTCQYFQASGCDGRGGPGSQGTGASEPESLRCPDSQRALDL